MRSVHQKPGPPEVAQLAERLRAERLRREMTWKMLAKEVRLSASTLKNLGRSQHKPLAPTLRRIRQFLNGIVPPEKIIADLQAERDELRRQLAARQGSLTLGVLTQILSSCPLDLVAEAVRRSGLDLKKLAALLRKPQPQEDDHG